MKLSLCLSGLASRLSNNRSAIGRNLHYLNQKLRTERSLRDRTRIALKWIWTIWWTIQSMIRAWVVARVKPNLRQGHLTEPQGLAGSNLTKSTHRQNWQKLATRSQSNMQIKVMSIKEPSYENRSLQVSSLQYGIDARGLSSSKSIDYRFAKDYQFFIHFLLHYIIHLILSHL